MHPAVLDFIARHVPDGPVSVLDLGGRDINGTTRALFPQATEWWCVDVVDAPGVDVVGDASTVTLGRLFDVVVCTEVLEHTPVWPAIIANAARHLNPGGRFIVTCAAPDTDGIPGSAGRPSHSGITGEATLEPGEWYCNVGPAEVERAMRAAGLTPHVGQLSWDTQGVGYRL